MQICLIAVAIWQNVAQAFKGPATLKTCLRHVLRLFPSLAKVSFQFFVVSPIVWILDLI